MSLAAQKTESATDELKALLGDRISTNPTVRDTHGKDESWHHPHRPDAVAFPNSTEEVSAIVKICASHHIPIIPFGTGTSVEGHVTAPYGGVTIDMMQMNEFIEVNALNVRNLDV